MRCVFDNSTFTDELVEKTATIVGIEGLRQDIAPPMRGLGKFRPLIAFLRLMGREKWALGCYCYCCSRRGLIHIAILAIFQIGEAGREGCTGE